MDIQKKNMLPFSMKMVQIGQLSNIGNIPHDTFLVPSQADLETSKMLIMSVWRWNPWVLSSSLSILPSILDSYPLFHLKYDKIEMCDIWLYKLQLFLPGVPVWAGTVFIFCPVARTGLWFGFSDINVDNTLMFQLLSRACSKSRTFHLPCSVREAVLERLGGRLDKPAKGIWHSLECHAQCTNWGSWPGGTGTAWEWAGHQSEGNEQLFRASLVLLGFYFFLSLCSSPFHYYYTLLLLLSLSLLL